MAKKKVKKVKAPEADPLIGRTITDCRAMTKDEAESEGWDFGRHGPPLLLVLDTGTRIFASRDPEGNGPGALFGIDSKGNQMAFNVQKEGSCTSL